VYSAMPSCSSQSAICCIAPLTDFTARLVALLDEGDGEFIRNPSGIHGLTAVHAASMRSSRLRANNRLKKIAAVAS
jgi:hypothetical protein